MPAHTLEWTADMARALPDDGQRYEVLDGVLVVTPAPGYAHQRVVGALYRSLFDYTEGHRIGRVMLSPADVEFSPRRLVQPDVFVIPWTTRAPASWREVTTLTLAIEVLSPGTAGTDRRVKRRLYQDQGVAEYWIVDPEVRRIERWRPADRRPEVVDAQLVWAPRAEDVPPLTISFDALFGVDETDPRVSPVPP